MLVEEVCMEIPELDRNLVKLTWQATHPGSDAISDAVEEARTKFASHSMTCSHGRGGGSVAVAVQ